MENSIKTSSKRKIKKDRKDKSLPSLPVSSQNKGTHLQNDKETKQEDIDKAQEQDTLESTAYDLISPFQLRSIEDVNIRKQCETLVDKIIQLQSELHSLRSETCQNQAELDLKDKWEKEFTEELEEAKYVHKMEIHQLHQRYEAAIINKRVLEKEIRELKNQLTQMKMDNSRLRDDHESLVTYSQNLNSSLSKVNAKCDKYRQDLTREKEISKALEDVNASLLERINALEQDSQTLQESSRNLKTSLDETTRKMDILSNEKVQWEKLEKQCFSKYQSIEKSYDECKRRLNQLMTERTALLKKVEDLENLQQEFEKNDIINGLREENVSFKNKLEACVEESARVIHFYEEKLKLVGETLDESDRVIELREKLRRETNEKEEYLSEIKKLQTLIDCIGKERDLVENQLRLNLRAKEDKIAELSDQVQTLHREKQELQTTKNSLLIEMESCIHTMNNEKENISQELHELRLNLQEESQEKTSLEEECKRLRHQVSTFADQYSHHQRLGQTLEDLTKAKTTLAYDKGTLQSKVEQLQDEVFQLRNCRSQLERVQSKLASVEDRYAVMQSEYSQTRSSLADAENEIKSVKQAVERKQKEVDSCQKERDEALRHVERLMGHASALEEREQKRLQAVMENYETVKSEQDRTQNTLESVLITNQNLQERVKLLQKDLGEKDHWLAHLREERNSAIEKERRYRVEVDLLQKKIRDLEQREHNEVIPMQTRLQTLETTRMQLEDQLSKQRHLLETEHLRTGSLEEQLTRRTQDLQQYKIELEDRRKEWNEHRQTYEKDLHHVRMEMKQMKDLHEKKLEEMTKQTNQVLEEKRFVQERLVELQEDRDYCHDELTRYKVDGDHREEKWKKQMTARETALQNAQQRLAHLEQEKQALLRHLANQEVTAKVCNERIALLKQEFLKLRNIQQNPNVTTTSLKTDFYETEVAPSPTKSATKSSHHKSIESPPHITTMKNLKSNCRSKELLTKSMVCEAENNFEKYLDTQLEAMKLYKQDTESTVAPALLF